MVKELYILEIKCVAFSLGDSWKEWYRSRVEAVKHTTRFVSFVVQENQTPQRSSRNEKKVDSHTHKNHSKRLTFQTQEKGPCNQNILIFLK